MSGKHKLQVPEGAGKSRLNEWIAVCSCGGRWRCYYSKHGLEWVTKKKPADDCPYKRN